MKRAMWKVDSNGTFRFSDKHDPNQITFLSAYDTAHLADTLQEKFRGQTVALPAIEEFTLVETPHFKFKEALNLIEMKRGGITVTGASAKRRRGTYPDDQWGALRLTFT